MADVQLLSLFLKDRDTFEKYEGGVPQHLLEEDTKQLMEDLRVWYRSHPGATGVNSPELVQDFWTWLKFTRHSNRPKEKLDMLKQFIQRALRDDTKQQAHELLRVLALRDWAGRIATKADKYSAGDTSFDLFEELLDDVEAAKVEAGIFNKHDHEVRTSIRDILAKYADLGSGLNWRSPNLSMAVGPIRKGDLVVVAAFVDTGKSTFVASEATYMATQLSGDEKVLFFNNEEEGDKVKLRLRKAALGVTHEELDLMDDGEQEAEYAKRMNGDPDRIVLIDSARITPALIRRKLREYNAKLVVVDQAYKVRVGKHGSDDKLGALQDTFEWFRGIAKEYCPVIGVHQARGDANGEAYIEMHQLAGSQQALQGEADVIITLGRQLGEGADEEARFIYTPKNKAETPGDPTMRNAKVKVYPRFNVARFDE